MRLDTLTLTNFRNYQSESLRFSSGVNIFIGENAQGKTNLLEAIYMLSSARSHRTAKDQEVINQDSDTAIIEGDIVTKHDHLPLQLSFGKDGKQARVNHIRKDRLSDYIGQLHAVLFAPEDLALVKGSPSLRRKFIDAELSQIDRQYLYQSITCRRLISQRNTYLKDIDPSNDQAMLYLDVLTDQVIDVTSQIMVARAKFIAEIGELAQELHHQLSSGREDLTLRYDASVAVDTDTTADALVEPLKAAFQRVKQRELRQGITLVGPHREDMTFYINNQALKQYGSQGQQRTAVLSLKLAEIMYIHQKLGDYPILLLDDVLSELDDLRQTHLLKTIGQDIQTFLTTTSLSGIQQEKIHQPALYEITGGHVLSREDQ
ncbi:MAG: DNA replication/repair protein RecF [Aerococcus sp.]|nr:DNA replication/repair protein RecF [Aerococcus sp.]